MVKQAPDHPYPHSAELFRFCKEALNIKHNFEVKVTDQHVGSILGFDPADCSHWKKGRKNIKSFDVLKTIAQHLDIDPRLVTDVACGRTDLEESLQEFKGFGHFVLTPKHYDELKRDYFRNPNRHIHSTTGEPKSFEEMADLKRSLSLKTTQEILERARILTYPVFLPEVLAVLPHISLLQDSLLSLTCPVQASVLPEGGYLIKHRSDIGRPHMRFLVAREVARIHLFPELVGSDVEIGEVALTRMNIFAGMLLIPSAMLQSAACSLDQTRDIVQQLADLFWIGRWTMNARLQDFFVNDN